MSFTTEIPGEISAYYWILERPYPEVDLARFNAVYSTGYEIERERHSTYRDKVARRFSDMTRNGHYEFHDAEVL